MPSFEDAQRLKADQEKLHAVLPAWLRKGSPYNCNFLPFCQSARTKQLNKQRGRRLGIGSDASHSWQSAAKGEAVEGF